MLEAFAVQAVIHCGDIGSPEIVRLFSGWPTHFVFGNVDLDYQTELRTAIREAELTCHDRFGQLELAGRRIAFLHGDDERRLRETTESGEWDLVCCGHTHVPEVRRNGPTTVLNPGAIFRATQHTVAVVDLATLDITSLVVS